MQDHKRDGSDGDRSPEDPAKVMKADIPPESLMNPEGKHAQRKHAQDDRQALPEEEPILRGDFAVKSQGECGEVRQHDEAQLYDDHEQRAIPLQPLTIAPDGPLEDLNERSSHTSEDF